MARQKKRRAFPVQETERVSRRDRIPESELIDADEPGFGIFGWFRSPGVRETIESVVIAVLLAFMFKTYEAEAFVIPTGSMAPSLQGQHFDHDCPKCGHRYLTGWAKGDSVSKTCCPICNHRTSLTKADPDHRINSGDRILVNKFIYDFQEPERFDVIVFKYPNNPKQNYIKRLIGLPGDNLLVENGDIYLMDPDGAGGWTNKRIARKPSVKVKQVLIDVDDTSFVPGELKSINWPSRWAQWDGGVAWTQSANQDSFRVSAKAQTEWLRYRNIMTPWSEINRNNGKLPERFDKPLAELPLGGLVTDTMCYNNKVTRRNTPTAIGNHWVGDLGVEAWVDVESSSGDFSLDLVEGGTHFTCQFNVADGVATLICNDPKVEFFNDSGVVAKPQAKTSVGPGSSQILLVNADDQIHMWVNGSLVEFDAPTFRREGVVIPQYSPANPGDAEPVGVGAKNITMTVSRLKVVRDIYYSSAKLERDGPGATGNESKMPFNIVQNIMVDPTEWDSRNGKALFLEKKNQTEPMFQLAFGADGNRAKDEFFPMGDNSTASLDARVWPGPDRFVPRDLLIGRAIFIYWPHSQNKPIPFFPNFTKMKFIR